MMDRVEHFKLKPSTLLNAGLKLEVFHSVHHDGRVRPMVLGLLEVLDDAKKAGDDGKAKVNNLLRPYFHAIGVIHVEENNKLGSHSITKYASTWCQSNGISKNDKDHRSHWKCKRICDTYNNVQLDWIDAKWHNSYALVVSLDTKLLILDAQTSGLLLTSHLKYWKCFVTHLVYSSEKPFFGWLFQHTVT